MNRSRVRPVVVSLFLAVAASLASAQPPPLQDFDAYVRRAIEDWGPPGLAVAVVKNGEVVFSKGYGVRELGKSGSVDTRTLFAIGSTTKAMTAAAVGMLVDEGRLGWDDPVTKHLPWFQVSDPYVTRELTLRDLLTHRAGLPNADFLWYEQDVSPREILERMRLVPMETSLRSHFTYQNVMYAAAGAIVAEVSGLSWDAFIQERILVPLGMTDTETTAARLASLENVASPHFRIDGEVRVIDNASVDAVAPAGSIWSSVGDMAKWMRYLLEGESFEGVRLLKDETYRELFTPQTLVDRDEFYPTQALTEPHWVTYGLGWFQEDYRGRAVDFHTGSIDGMVALHGLVRAERLGVYVLSNLDHAELRHALMYRVFDLYAGSAERDWSAELKKLYDELAAKAEEKEEALEAKRVPGTRPRLPLERYAGTYSDPLYGTLVVTSAPEGLRLRYGPGLQGKLEHWHYDVFQVTWDAAWRGTAMASFELDLDGQSSVVAVGDARFHREPE